MPLVQVVSLFPLFPGTNEMDQIEKIHAIMGTPPPEVLARMKKHSTHIEYDFNPKVGSSHAVTARRHPACMSWGFKLVWAAYCGLEVCPSACGGSFWPWSRRALHIALHPHRVQL